MINYLDTQPCQAPYCAPIIAALDWLAGKPIDAIKLRDLEDAAQHLAKEHESEMTYGGVPVFEPEDPAKTKKGDHYKASIVCKEGEQYGQGSDILEKLPAKTTTADPAKDAIPLVSLGCSCGPKLSFKEIGRGAETLPFDWVRTRLSAVTHFLSSDFQGFFDFTYTEEIDLPESQRMLCIVETTTLSGMITQTMNRCMNGIRG